MTSKVLTFRAAHVGQVRGHDDAAAADAIACANAVVRETRIASPRRRDEAPTVSVIPRGAHRYVNARNCASRPRQPGMEKAPVWQARLRDPANPCDNIAPEHSATAHASGIKLQMRSSARSEAASPVHLSSPSSAPNRPRSRTASKNAGQAAPSATARRCTGALPPAPPPPSLRRPRWAARRAPSGYKHGPYR